MLDFLALKKAHAAIYPVSQCSVEQGMFQHPRLCVGTIKQRHLCEYYSFGAQRFHLVDDERSLIEIGRCVIHAQQFAMTFRSPQVFAKTSAIVAYQRVGGIQYVAVRAVVLFQFDDFRDAEVTLEILHVAGIGTAKCINALVVIAHHKHSGSVTGQQFEPFVLQPAGVLKLVDQNMAEARAVMLAQNLVADE